MSIENCEAQAARMRKSHPELCINCGCGWLMHATWQDDVDRYLMSGCDLHAECTLWEPDKRGKD